MLATSAIPKQSTTAVRESFHVTCLASDGHVRSRTIITSIDSKNRYPCASTSACHVHRQGLNHGLHVIVRLHRHGRGAELWRGHDNTSYRATEAAFPLHSATEVDSKFHHGHGRRAAFEGWPPPPEGCSMNGSD
jgi:hypothetical protein